MKNNVKIIIVSSFILLGVLFSWLIYSYERIYIFILILIAFIAFLIMANKLIGKFFKEKDLFSPLIAFPLLYIVYFGFGSLSIFPNTDKIPLQQWTYYLVGIISYFAGILLVSTARRGINSHQRVTMYKWNQTRLWIAIYALVVVGTFFEILRYRQTGIPIFSGDVAALRVQANISGYFTLLANGSFQLALLLIFANFLARGKLKWSKVYTLWNILIVMYLFFMLFSSGNRGTWMFPLGALVVIYSYLKKHISMQQAITAVAIGMVFISIIGYHRVVNLYGTGWGKWVENYYDLPQYGRFWWPAYTYVRNGPLKFKEITEIFPQKIDYQYGYHFFSPLTTILPGEQESPDLFIKRALQLEFIGFGVAASMLSSFYIDFGLAGIVVGMFLCGLIAMLLFKWMKSQFTPFRVVIYGLFTAQLIFALYGNIFPHFGFLWLYILAIIVHLFSKEPVTKIEK